MSEKYLLAAGILMLGPIAANATSPRSSELPEIDPSLVAWNLEKQPKNLKAMAKIAITPDISQNQPQFSQPHLIAQTAIALNPYITNPSPRSGPQLYQQRVAALKAGRLHTRLQGNSFYPQWKNASQQPTYEQWKQLLTQEAKAASKGQGSNRLSILVGDSLTLWFPSQSLSNHKFWLNQGISGENSAQVWSRLSSLSMTRPDTIYVMVGINDLRQGATDQAILNNMRGIVRRLRQNHPQAEIVVQSILPTRNQGIANSRIRHLNEQIMMISRQEGGNYLNLYDLFVDEQDQLKPNLTTDGLHLNPQGYQVWKSALDYAESWIAYHRSDSVAMKN
jgi:lysophospholipase L1-like esterase